MAERAILEAQGKTKGEGEEVKPPKTAALWTQLERLGWRHDSLPVATIMASYESMEEELAELKAGFDAEGRTAAEACCEEFKREQAKEIRRLDLRSIKLAEDLDQARQDAIRALGERNDARKELAARTAAFFSIDAHLDECVEKSAQSWKPLPGDPEQFYTQEGNEHSH